MSSSNLSGGNLVDGLPPVSSLEYIFSPDQAHLGSTPRYIMQSYIMKRWGQSDKYLIETGKSISTLS